MRVSVEDGKYTYVITETNAHVLRYGELWRDATGDKFTYCMAAEIESLREQVEKLTKERDTEIARNRPLQSLVKSQEEIKSFLLKKSEENKEAVKQLDSERHANALLTEELAALAEQNEKQRAFLEFAWKGIPMNEYSFKILEDVMNLPNLAAPALNRIRAVGMRMAAQFIEDKYDFLGEEITVADEILAKADELSKGETR